LYAMLYSQVSIAMRYACTFERHGNYLIYRELKLCMTSASE
jgi:hypothetical protein